MMKPLIFACLGLFLMPGLARAQMFAAPRPGEVVQAPVPIGPDEATTVGSAQPMAAHQQMPQQMSNQSQVMTPAAGSGFPATREQLEQAAVACQSQVQQLWEQRSQVPPYRRRIFDTSIGEAQQMCRKLDELVNVIKQADERLYTFQQSLAQAQGAFQ